jgi:hypothetical protein
MGTSVAVKLDSLPPNGAVILQVTGVDGRTDLYLDNPQS